MKNEITTYVTDNIGLRKKHPDFLFLNDIYQWRVYHKSGKFEIQKHNSSKLKTNNVSGIVSPSNYKLIYDLIVFNKKIVFYKPERFSFLSEWKPDLREIKRKFSDYMKRGYISYLLYPSYSRLGFKRIEQVVVFLASQKKRAGALKIKNIISEEEVENKTPLYAENIIELLHFKKSMKYIDAISFLLSEYNSGRITDPLSDNAIEMIDKSSELFSVIGKIKKKTILRRVKILLADGKEKEIHSSSSMESAVLFGVAYENEMMEENSSLLFLAKQVYPILTRRDFLLTLFNLIKQGIIVEENGRLVASRQLAEKIPLKENTGYVTKKNWKSVYESDSYLFGHVFEELFVKEWRFVCPLCGGKKYNITPDKFFCRTNGCEFLFLRNNLKRLGIDRVDEDSFISAINSGGALLTRGSEKGVPVLLRTKDNKCFFLSKKFSG